jgi:hypothetical protein
MFKYISSCIVAVCFVFLTVAQAAKPPQKSPNRTYDYAITLGEETFDPKFQVIVSPTEWEVVSQQGNDLRLVQFDGPIQESWIADMEDAGVTPVQYSSFRLHHLV